MKKAVLLLTVTLLAFTFNTNAAKLQFVFWTNGAPSVSDAQTIAYYTTSLKVGAIAGAEIRSTVANYKEVYGEQGYQVLISAQPSDFTIGYSTGVEENWGIENGKSVITGTLVAGVKIILYKGVPVAKWGTNGCLNPLTVPAAPKNDPADRDNYAGTPPANNNRQSGPNPNGDLTNTLTMLAGSTKNDHSDLILGYFMRQSALDHDAIVLAKFANNSATPCNVCPQATAAAPVQQVAYAPQPVLYTQTAAPAVAQQANYPLSGNVNVSGTVNVRNNTRAVDVLNTVFNGVSAASDFKNAFFPATRNINVTGLNNTAVYPNTWIPPVYGTGNNGGFQGSSDPRYTSTGTTPVNTSATTSIFATGTSTSYDNGNWATNPGGSNIIGQR